MRSPPRPDGRGGREVVAAALTAPMHRQRGAKGLAEQPYHGRKIHPITSQSENENRSPFSLHFCPQTCCFYLPELLKRNVRKYGEKLCEH